MTAEDNIVIKKIYLDKPIHFTGLSLKASGLPGAYESMGLLWDRFHQEVLPGLGDQVWPRVEVAVCTAGDYIVGGQTTGGAVPEGLAGYSIPAGAYLKAEFSAGDFSQLVDDALPNLWPKVEAWAKEQNIAFEGGGLFAAEIYPQETVALPRPGMYCLYPIKQA